MITKIREIMRGWGASETLWFAFLVVSLAIIMSVVILPEAGVDTTPTKDDVNINTTAATGVQGFNTAAFCEDPETKVSSFQSPDSGMTVQLLRVRDNVPESVIVVYDNNQAIRIATHYYSTQAGQQEELAFVSDEARSCIERKEQEAVFPFTGLVPEAVAHDGAPHPDIFQAAGIPNMQTLNPVNVKAKSQRTAAFRLLTVSGCSAGSIPNDIALMQQHAREEVGFNLIRNDTTYDFTVRINCGTSHIAVCGSINIFCLGRGFPYVADVDINDILSQWPYETRLSILLHEIMAHAVGTWNEQYCIGNESVGNICHGLPRFASAPNWRDFMNTGPLSRHGYEGIELSRWERTMYALTQEPPPECAGPVQPNGLYWNQCTMRWYNSSSWSYDPTVNVWFTPGGRAEWGTCNTQDRACWHIPSGTWLFENSHLYLPSEDLHYTLPLG